MTLNFDSMSKTIYDQFNEITDLKSRITELESNIEAMKCCGNCKHYVPLIGQDQCDTGKYRHEWKPITGDNKCENWDVRG